MATKAKRWTKPEELKLQQNYYSASQEQLVKLLGRKWAAIYSRAMQLGLYGKNKFKYND